ncbi:hypothetical protein [Colwellia polaris]|jgi:hypothetical protein|uniref:hypothetical protein n=1 Tax=Colwellia polaris TaxID=326537 RepID=UPI000A176552|nr:hypothetical protein [Colwellia polaris]|tara:strand:+ start:64 stop:345 length:282 start_codon:yes stop_codon:yes gene_type:complete
MDLYTLILDFKGGTFISQCISPCKEDALYQGVLNWDISAIESVITGNSRNILLEDIENEELTQLQGMKNVWSCSVFVGDELMLINLIATKDVT